MRTWSGNLFARGIKLNRAASVPISSTKSAIGHLLGVAGAVEAIATILALRERVIPPTIGLDQPEPGLDLDFVPNVARELVLGEGERAIGVSNSFGFGGHNAVLVLEAASPEPVGHAARRGCRPRRSHERVLRHAGALSRGVRVELDDAAARPG